MTTTGRLLLVLLPLFWLLPTAVAAPAAAATSASAAGHLSPDPRPRARVAHHARSEGSTTPWAVGRHLPRDPSPPAAPARPARSATSAWAPSTGWRWPPAGSSEVARAFDPPATRHELGPLSTAWRWPLAGSPEVVRVFDPPATRYGRGHRGVDLAGVPGAVVRAAGTGTVGYAGVLAGRGVISVRHAGGLRTTYEPVVATVRRGDRVAAGSPLGRLAAGHPGCPRTACLHWGLLRGDTYLDPLSLLGRGPVRLLPRADAPPTPSIGHAVPSLGQPVGIVAPSSGAGIPPVPPAATAAAVGLALAGVVLLARRRPP